jgi:hypothetical protein
MNQIKMDIVYATDNAIKNRIGTLTLTALTTSSMYSGSVTLNFTFAPRLDKVLTIGNLEQGYDVNEPTQVKDNLIESAFVKNSDRIPSLDFLKSNISVSYQNLANATFSPINSQSAYIGNAVTLSIFNTYKITPDSVFTYSSDGATITGFADDTKDLSNYNLLNFPDTRRVNNVDVKITSISKNFNPDANKVNDVVPVAYRSLQDGGSLNYLHLPKYLTNLSGKFQNCKSFIGSVYLPGTITSISADCFGQTKINSVTYGVGCTSTYSDRFCAECTYLKVITFPSTLTSINYHFSKYSAQTSINIPDSVTGIGAAAFKQMYDASSPSKPTLETVYLGKANTIGSETFRSNPNIKSITANYSTLPTG